jgi:hypothetical protein
MPDRTPSAAPRCDQPPPPRPEDRPPRPTASAAQDRLTIREAFDLRYHVPRSQVWEGSRGFQRGNVHLRVKRGEAFQAGRIRRVEGQTLCGKVAWYDRVPDSTEAATEAQFCARCIEIGTRHDGRLTALVKA